MRLSNYPSSLVYQIKSFEKLPVELFQYSDDACKHIAHTIALAIRAKQQRNKKIVLGLATGSSPIKVYSELIRMHKKEGLSFQNVYTFNLDEYFPLPPEDQESYHYFMNEYLFNHIDIPKENIHIPKGDIPLSEVENFCAAYEKKIEALGGIDIQILGIGRTGHIGFNEPGSDTATNTRLVRLDNITRRDATNDFGGLGNVPYQAITMGVNTIMKAKEIYIMAWGQHKAPIVQKAIESEPDPRIPATFLQNHEQVRFFLDEAAAGKLTRVTMPWKVGSCAWDEDLACKAVIWLSRLVKKPILKLTNEHYNEHGLSELILKDSAYNLNINTFNKLQHTVTGWPGGKPKVDDSQRPERANPANKRVVIFSPHPDDDVISMGGTFLRLVDQAHDVHVAYQTSGNIAVHEHDVLRYLEFFEEYQGALDPKAPTIKELQKAKKILQTGKGNKNAPEIRKIKGLIRRGEARTAARFCGLTDKNIHHLDLPFYETGTIKKKSMSQQDIEITTTLLQEIKPHQIFAAGDLSDPHGTHRVCINIILESLKLLKSEPWLKDCWLWLYRGAWQEFEIDEIDMAVPLSPDELLKKRQAIFMHQSQKDSPPFPGEDMREFWQRSEDRNRYTAQSYRDLGFAAYEAMEAFRRYKF